MAVEGPQFYDEDIIGYLAVNTDDAQDILTRGYVCSTKMGIKQPPPGQDSCHTRRDHVPIAQERTSAVQVLRKRREGVQFSTILEVRKRAQDGTIVPHDQIQIAHGHILPDPGTYILDKKFISNGIVFERGAGESAEAPCPLCGDPLEGEGGHRGKVGLACYVGDAFMVSPCPKASCIKRQEDRQKRIDSMNTMTLYHACSRPTADKIKACGGKLIRGSSGAGGGGIYFAHTPREIEWKAEDAGGPKSNPNYVIFECEVKMGSVYQGKREERSTTFAALIKLGEHDSLILDRGNTGYPVPAAPVKGTRQEDLKPGEKIHPGYEFVVYSWDQVKIIGEVARDPVA